MHIVIHHQIKQINATAWNGLLDNNNPFMRHEYLNGLEICECVNAETGWQPMHIAAYVDASQTELLGAMPCYLKTNSYGEYIFDWAWADLYYRNNHDYYPKLTNAIPFTPATGARWLTTHKSNDYSSSEVAHALLNRALSLVEEKQLSGFHSLFVDKEQSEQLVAQKLLQRITNQFHWQNNNYADFAAFLACMNSKKRKNIKRERRRVNESNIHYQWITGEELTVEHAQQMYQFYRRTINHYGAQPYLNSNFYQYLTDSFADQTFTG